MKSAYQEILAVPTNIITGFLGVGKTTTILNLLENKPSDERWALLINEFGEIGIDHSLIKGQYSEKSGVFIREVPGGCMCCAAGLPMQMALNMLLARARPDRLLIEPTGLGHPLEVLQVLSGEHYRDVLSLEKILTLVDARKLSDERYTTNDTFNQQLALADIVIGNKSDLYESDDVDRLTEYVGRSCKSGTQVLTAQQGNVSLELLQGATAQQVEPVKVSSGQSIFIDLPERPLPASGITRSENRGDGFASVGWRFDSRFQFNRARLFAFLSGLAVERMKGVFITSEGVFGYNLADGTLSDVEIDESIESRVELIIAGDIEEQWEAQLRACIAT